MRKIIVALFCILLMSTAWANDLRIIYPDTINAADTVAAAKRVDTLYSAWVPLKHASSIHFMVELQALPGYTDTNFTADSFFIDWQFSFNQIDVKTVEIDTLLDNGVAWQEDDDVVAVSEVFGNWGRFRFIHWDSAEAALDLKDNIYYKEALLWYYLEGIK